MIIDQDKSQSLSFCVLFIILLGVLAFAATLKAGFIWDDHEMIVNNPVIKSVSLSHLKHIFTHDIFEGHGDAYYRPVQSLSYMADYAIWGLHPVGYHITNLLLHLANAVLLFFIFSLLFSNQQIGFFSASLFVVHPIIIEQLLIIAGRAELLSTFFMFFGIYYLFRNPKSIWIPLASFALSLLSKESGMAMPILLGLVWIKNPKFKLSRKLMAGFMLVFGAYLLIRHWVLPITFLPLSRMDMAMGLIRDVPSSITEYLRIILLPFDLHSHRRMIFSIPYAAAAILFWIGALVFLAMKKNREGLFFLGWYLLAFLPKIPLLVTNALMLDHWAYVSAAGICGALALLVNQSHQKFLWAQKFSYVVFGGLLCFWMLLSAFYGVARGSDEKMYLWALRYPSSSIVRSNLGLIYYQQGQYQMARPLLEESLKMNFNTGSANILALTEWKLGNERQAINRLEKLILTNPNDFQSRNNLALIIGGRDGLKIINEVLESQPQRIGSYLIKAALQLSLHDEAGARETYLKVLSLDPDNYAARKALESSAHLLQLPHG